MPEDDRDGIIECVVHLTYFRDGVRLYLHHTTTRGQSLILCNSVRTTSDNLSIDAGIGLAPPQRSTVPSSGTFVIPDRDSGLLIKLIREQKGLG